jgi:hypothetical protein
MQKRHDLDFLNEFVEKEIINVGRSWNRKVPSGENMLTDREEGILK